MANSSSASPITPCPVRRGVAGETAGGGLAGAGARTSGTERSSSSIWPSSPALPAPTCAVKSDSVFSAWARACANASSLRVSASCCSRTVRRRGAAAACRCSASTSAWVFCTASAASAARWASADFASCEVECALPSAARPRAPSNAWATACRASWTSWSMKITSEGSVTTCACAPSLRYQPIAWFRWARIGGSCDGTWSAASGNAIKASRAIFRTGPPARKHGRGGHDVQGKPALPTPAAASCPPAPPLLVRRFSSLVHGGWAEVSGQRDVDQSDRITRSAAFAAGAAYRW